MRTTRADTRSDLLRIPRHVRAELLPLAVATVPTTVQCPCPSSLTSAGGLFLSQCRPSFPVSSIELTDHLLISLLAPGDSCLNHHRSTGSSHTSFPSYSTPRKPCKRANSCVLEQARSPPPPHRQRWRSSLSTRRSDGCLKRCWTSSRCVSLLFRQEHGAYIRARSWPHKSRNV